MATCQKVTEHFLTCTVCMDVFNDPITLDCQHAFCRKCVTSFTKTQPEAISAKSFPCHFCRRLMKVPDPDRPVEEWAWQVKPSYLIQGLLDSFGHGTKDTTNCSYCKDEGETTAATVWCSACGVSLCNRCHRVHRRIPGLGHHEVAQLSEEVKVVRKRTVMCKEHETECIRFLCKNCKKAVCQTCYIIHHRKCDSVVTIESELPAMKSALTRNRESLLKKREYYKMDTEEKSASVAEGTKMCSKIEKEIKSLSQTARDIISDKENKLLSQLKNISDTQIGKLRADVKTEEMAIQMFNQQSELIAQVLKSDCEIDIYEMYQSCESERKTEANLTTTAAVPKVTLRNDAKRLTEALKQLQLGEIEVRYEDGIDLTATPVLLDTIDIRVTGDQNEAPSDVTVLNVNGIDTVVVTDRYNENVKSFYNRNNQPCHSKLSLDSDPWSLTQLTHNQVAVTVPDANQIVTVEVKPELKILSTITTKKGYYGITFLPPSSIVTGSRDPPSVDILDMTGTVIRSITQHTNKAVVFKDPHFLSTTKKGHILAADHGTKSVLCLTDQGDVVFNYSTELSLYGVTSSSTGDILVVDYTHDKVIHLTESGQFVGNTLTSQDGLSYPHGLCIDKYGRLYVCLRFDGVIKVFKFTK